MAATVFVVTDVLYDTTWALLVMVATGSVFVLLWFTLPAGWHFLRRPPAGPRE